MVPIILSILFFALTKAKLGVFNNFKEAKVTSFLFYLKTSLLGRSGLERESLQQPFMHI